MVIEPFFRFYGNIFVKKYNMSEQFLTAEGVENLKEQLQKLKDKRKEITARIQSAKELGDLSENAEYSEAKDAQAMNESEIAKLEELIKDAKIITKTSGAGVSVGSTVTVEINGKEMTYTIVGSNEADPKSGKISNESPMGRSFLGKEKGETTSFDTPRGSISATIKNVD